MKDVSSVEVDVYVNSKSNLNDLRKLAKIKFLEHNHQKFQLHILNIIAGAPLRDDYDNTYVPLYISYKN